MVSFNLFTNSKTTKQLENVLTNIKSAKCRERFSCLTRCVLVFSNSLALLFAFILIVTGNVHQTFYVRDYGWLQTIDATCICVGLLVGITAIFGFLGALIESAPLLMMYAVMQTTGFIFLIIVNIIFYATYLIQPKAVVEYILQFLYENNSMIICHYVVDFIHERLHCCGLHGPGEFLNDYSRRKMIYGSCCKSGNECSVDGAYQDNCVAGLDYYFPYIFAEVFKIVLVFGAFQVIYAALAYFVARTIKKRTVKYERIPEVFTSSK